MEYHITLRGCMVQDNINTPQILLYEEDAFEVLDQILNSEIMSDDSSVNDVLLSFLLTEDSVNLSDEQFLNQLSNITRAYVFSGHTDSMSYRLIGINHDIEREFIWYDTTWSYFVQAWNNSYIWAQPLLEGTEIIFNQAVFITNPNANELVILTGHTREPHGGGLAVASTGFVFMDGIWEPIDWDKRYEDLTMFERRIYADGFLKVVQYPPSWGISNDDLPFFLMLKADGSIWTDYSIIENSTDDELLFRLKQ
jgi:hypothetical protein